MKEFIVKVRVWDEEFKKMRYNALAGEGEKISDGWHGGSSAHGFTLSLGRWTGEKEFTYFPQMLFTGLNDKNGVELFQSDIVKDEQGNLHEIVFGKIGYDSRHNGLTGFALSGNYHSDDFYELYWTDDFKELEIVGNIYENKDLLK